eukprot:m.340051 g.340051  ORF g.340051 m.340051 type:complete len:743 (-) comp19104_c0_seq1:56-2284(-)
MRLYLTIVFSVLINNAKCLRFDNTNTQFTTLPYAAIKGRLLQMAKSYPDLVKVWNAQDYYNLSSPGTCGEERCEQWFAQITNHRTIEAHPERPEVFFSGSVHGNERVGPTTTVEFAELLVENYKHGSNEWLQWLVDSRSIWIMPNANAHGYYSNVRTEHGIDPNRDFPYGRSARQCMQTVCARALNELYRDHMFQLAITFHGGMKAIAYEWGSPNHPRGSDASPDDNAMASLGSLMKKFSSETYYPEGKLNSIVYPVWGGMEDWAYASSWDTKFATPCEADGYPRSKTVYDDSMLRTYNILVETANMKAPYDSTMGSSSFVLQNAGASSDGHVPRNIRLCLALADLVQPYVRWMDKISVDTTGYELVNSTELSFSWDIGGGLALTETKLFILPAEESEIEACPTEISYNLRNRVINGSSTISMSTNGQTTTGTIWNTVLTQRSKTPSAYSQEWSPFRPRFQRNGYQFPKGGKWLVFAGARVDQSWGAESPDAHPKIPPQAHVARARNTEGYYKTNNGKIVEGHSWWLSKVRCIEVPSPSTLVPLATTLESTTEEVSTITTTAASQLTDSDTIVPQASTLATSTESEISSSLSPTETQSPTPTHSTTDLDITNSRSSVLTTQPFSAPTSSNSPSTSSKHGSSTSPSTSSRPGTSSPTQKSTSKHDTTAKEKPPTIQFSTIQSGVSQGAMSKGILIVVAIISVVILLVVGVIMIVRKRQVRYAVLETEQVSMNTLYETNPEVNY